MSTDILNYAFYYIAYGDSARDRLRLAYNSLRIAGFKNDVFIFSDTGTVPFEVDANTHVLRFKEVDINLNEDAKGDFSTFDVRDLNLKNKENHKPENRRKYTITRATSLIPKYIDVTAYTHIVGLDVDVLAQGPVIDFDSYIQANHDQIVIAANRIKYLGGRWHYFTPRWFKHSVYTANLSLVELLRNWHVRPICTDAFIIPSKLAVEMYNAWQKECSRGLRGDQAALQAVLLRHYSNQYVLAPFRVFGNGVTDREYDEGRRLVEKVDAQFVHFHGAIRDGRGFTEYYQDFLT